MAFRKLIQSVTCGLIYQKVTTHHKTAEALVRVGEESVKLSICCARTHSPRFQEEATVGSLINMFFFPQVDKHLIHVFYQHVFHSGPPVPTLQHTQNILCVCVCVRVGGWLGVSRLHACSEMHSC